eukprot:PhM_4_TR18693/c1_g1_i1/m.98836
MLLLLQHRHVNGELNSIGRGPRAEVVHARLEAHAPRVEVHRRERAAGGALQEQVQGLRLVNVRRARRGHVDDILLLDLPHGAVDALEVRAQVGDVLDAAVVGDDGVACGVAPQPDADEITHKVLVHDRELAAEHTAEVHVRRVGLEALVVAQDLRRRRRWHRRYQERVAHAVLLHLSAEGVPVPTTALRLHIPHVELEDPARDGGPGEGLVRTALDGTLAGLLHRGVVDSLEDVLVQALRLRARKGDLELEVRVREALHTEADGAVLLVAAARGLRRVVVKINNVVEVARGDAGDGGELLEVERLVVIRDTAGQRDGCQVAHRGLLRGRVLNDLRAEIAALDRAEVLLVGLAVARVLVQHVGRAGL